MHKDDIKDFEDVANDVLQYMSKQIEKKFYKRKDSNEVRNLECVMNLLQVTLSSMLWGNGLYRKIFLFDKKLKDKMLNDLITKCDETITEMHNERMEALKCGATLH